MSKIPAGAVVVAQVMARVSDVAAALILLDYNLRYVTFISRAKECRVGDIVFCRVTDDGRIDKILKAGRKTRDAYAGKALDFRSKPLNPA